MPFFFVLELMFLTYRSHSNYQVPTGITSVVDVSF